MLGQVLGQTEQNTFELTTLAGAFTVHGHCERWLHLRVFPGAVRGAHRRFGAETALRSTSRPPVPRSAQVAAVSRSTFMHSRELHSCVSEGCIRGLWSVFRSAAFMRFVRAFPSAELCNTGSGRTRNRRWPPDQIEPAANRRSPRISVGGPSARQNPFTVTSPE